MEPRVNRLDTSNKFDNTHILLPGIFLSDCVDNSDLANPNAMPQIHELGTFPETYTQSSFIQSSGAPPSYSQTINPELAPAQNFVIIHHLQLGPYPASIRCPHCQYHVITKVVNRAGLLTYFISCVLALIGCWPFCLLPFCLDRCQVIFFT
jgi:hypothetical protein